METVLKAISDWIKSLLTAAIMSNLSGLFDDVNTQVGNIAQQVGTKPSSFEPRVFAMIEALSRNVVLPIAGVILTFIACYELIQMITEHNNMAQFEPALLMKWIFKTAISVWMISNTFDIIMAVFDVTQQVVANSSGIISGNTRVNDIGLSMLQSSMMQMDVGPLFGLFLQSFFIGITMRILSIVIFVIVYGRMIEIYEEQEEGVSGHKVRAAARDKLQIIKDYARKGKFDILLVFMFDRIGRIADETPFVVEWFVRNGIRVWSTQEGEQRFDNHTDKLLNYIRFWQADGESEKTSVRTRTSLRQLVEEGHFKGGNAPYGYDLVRSGRINKRKHELYELHINEQEAAVVRIVFDKYVYEGYGPQHIATYLNNSGYRARSGKCWHPSSIRGMVQNLTYTGVLRCGDARSELMPDLQIVPQEQFENAQRIRNERSVRSTAEAENRLPLNIHGKSLLAGNAYCGHCGAKLELTSSRKWRKMADGSLDDTLRIRYTCYGKLRKQTNCTGQTGYTVHILDEIIDKAVRQIFSKMRGIPKEQIVTKRYEKENAERKNHLQDLQTQRNKAEKDLLALKTEVLACIKGESVLPRETLAEMITAQEEKLTELENLCEAASEELEKTAELMDKVSRLYDELISYADLYDSANFEAKKMIVNQLIRRVDVYRGYQINISFNFDLTPYIEGE